MDQKGSLIDTQLKIYPTDNLLAFLKTLPAAENIPANVSKAIGRDFNEAAKPTEALILKFTDKDFENLNIIREIVKDKFKEEIGNSKTAFDEDTIKSTVEQSEVDNKSSDEGIDVDSKAADIDQPSDPSETADQPPASEAPVKTIPYLTTSDIDWLYAYLQKRKSNNEEVPYLHNLLAGANIEVPENKRIKRNPDLEARCVKLRAQQEAREYRKMTKTVDNVRLRFPEDSISYQMKQLNRQLIAIGQFIISIFAGFLFGFKGLDWMIGNLDFGFRLLLGVMCALVIALAEIYFLAKKLNEELNIPETTQLGGPPKFVDEDKYMPTLSKKTVKKEHQD